MKKVLVTGATGFIGNYVVKELLHRNYIVIATSSSREKASQMSWYKKVDYITFDLRTADEHIDYFQFFHQPDALIHLAWEGLPNYKHDFHLNENYPRHLTLLNNMLQNGLKDLTVTGTCLEYGMQEGQLSENIASLPANAYAAAKDKLRKNLALLCEIKSVPFKWVRLFYMYGEGQHPNSLISQVEKALEEEQEVFNMSGGDQQRDFLPVHEVAEYIVAIATQNNVTGNINCCSGKPVILKNFVRDYLKQKNRSIRLNLGFYPYADYEPMCFWGDNTKLKSIIKNTAGK